MQDLAGPRAADRSSVEQLVQQIGGYPLVLQLIGSYLSSHQEEAEDYLRWFEGKGLMALDQGKRQAQSIPLLLQRTYDSLPNVEQEVFALLGLLAPAPLPEEAPAFGGLRCGTLLRKKEAMRAYLAVFQ